MTEAEWLTSDNPAAMLRALRGRASKRKLLLFLCACCREWENVHLGRLVELGERLADGRATVADFRAAIPIPIPPGGQLPGGPLDPATVWQWVDPERVATAATHIASLRSLGGSRVRAGLWRGQVRSLRELVGNPFHPVELSEAVRCFEGGVVVRLAESIYEAGDFARLPVLGDALEEAGAPAAMVAHCREAGPHVRGCWVVDAILGKE